MATQFHNQQGLFDGGSPHLDVTALSRLERTALDDAAWVEYLPGWIRGQDALMSIVESTTAWREEERRMYDRIVAVPRLVATLPDDGPGHPLLLQIRDSLSAHYAVALVRIGLGYYRNGDDSVAWHGDTLARDLPEALVATVSLGTPRRFLLRPRGGGRSVAYTLGAGDLFVMGGACQRTWQHAIPKVARAAPRLAVMFRPVWNTPVAPAFRGLRLTSR